MRIIVSCILLYASCIGWSNTPFNLQVKYIDANSFSLIWQIKSGHFLYADRISLKIPKSTTEQIEIVNLRKPKALLKTDYQGKRVPIYRNQVNIHVAILSHQPGELIVYAHAQGCSDSGYCYPPTYIPIQLTLNTDYALERVSVFAEDHIDTHKFPQVNPYQKNFIITLILFFIFGLLLAFTPCILPMIPVLSSIIIGHGQSITKKKSFLLSLSYVLSMSLTYAIIGACIALLGNNLQIILQSPWSICTLSIIYIVLALSMFDLYQIRLPETWAKRLAQLSYSHATGQYLGSAIMGALSTLILSPCVSAPMIGALSYIAQTGNIIFGTLTLFILGLGMGTPLLIIGASLGKFLPHVGTWMYRIKQLMGVILIIVAIQLLSRILPTNANSGSIYTQQQAQNLLTQASLTHKPVVVDFYADWCSSCKKIEDILQHTALLKKFVLIKADITANNVDSTQLMQYFNVIAPPTLLFFDKQGNEIKHLRIIGDTSTSTLQNTLHFILQN